MDEEIKVFMYAVDVMCAYVALPCDKISDDI